MNLYIFEIWQMPKHMKFLPLDRQCGKIAISQLHIMMDKSNLILQILSL